jgi:hypothetical protein
LANIRAALGLEDPLQINFSQSNRSWKSVGNSIYNVHQIYVDFRRACDSIQREKLYRIMHEFNIPNKLIRLVRATMRNSEAQVKIQTQLAEPFKIRQGLKQGDGLAPSLFNLALEYAIKN